MKKLVLTSLSAILLATAANAGGYMGGYLTTASNSEAVLFGNDVDNEVEFLDQLNFDLTFGYKFDNGMRLEADIMTMRLNQKDVDFSDSFAMGINVGEVRALYDFDMSSPITPYAGVGMSSFVWADNDVSFDVSGIVGLSYDVTNMFSMDLQYSRQFGFTSAGPDWTYDGVNQFRLGGRYMF